MKPALLSFVVLMKLHVWLVILDLVFTDKYFVIQGLSKKQPKGLVK